MFFDRGASRDTDVCDRGNEQGMGGLRMASHGPGENHTARVKWMHGKGEKAHGYVLVSEG